MFRKVLCGIIAAGYLAGGPVWADEGSAVKVPVTEFDLPNGLHVILHEDHSVPMVHTNIWYYVGSSNEQPGRTGFAHLFEHLMYEGSGHVPSGHYDKWLAKVGASNNGSTNCDRTNYYISMPSGSLDLALFLESDRMGFLLDSMSENIVDCQRDVVKNEMRQSYLNRPYGKIWLELFPLMYPQGHPYSWPVIGSMDDLSAAQYKDVADFFKTYYVPNNASLVVAGDIDTAKVRKQVEYWFSDVPRGADVQRSQPSAALPELKGVVKKTVEDDVELPLRLMAWHTPAAFSDDDLALDMAAMILSGTKNSRLYKRLVYESQAAASVEAEEDSMRRSSMFMVTFLPRPGHDLEELQKAIDEEIARLSQEPPTAEEMEIARNTFESSFYLSMEKCGSVANILNSYRAATGEADYFETALERYRAITPEQISAVCAKYLGGDCRVELTVVPKSQAQAGSAADVSESK